MNQAINHRQYVIKIFIFSQVMAKNGVLAHICVWAVNFYGNLGDYYLSIGGAKSKL